MAVESQTFIYRSFGYITRAHNKLQVMSHMAQMPRPCCNTQTTKISHQWLIILLGSDYREFNLIFFCLIVIVAHDKKNRWATY